MPTQQEILLSLGIPASTAESIASGETALVLLEASAHLDWDWQLPFPVLLTGGQSANGSRAQSYFVDSDYPRGCAADIFSSAASSLLSQYGDGFRYSICEQGYVQGLASSAPSQFAQLFAAMKQTGNLWFGGGGITSPDNQLPHGEAFLRNFLLGHQWLASAYGSQGITDPPTITQAFMPDDFGHDPQLPVMLAAMGFVGIGFARMPGDSRTDIPGIDGSPNLAAQLKSGTAGDFIWLAADGSRTIGHWMPNWYAQGNTISARSDIDDCAQQNLPYCPTQYVYVPVLNDFSMPNENLAAAVSGFNATPPSIGNRRGYAVIASFEHFIGLLAACEAESPGGLTPRAFYPAPYYTGTQGTRPAIKALHHRVVRDLLAAETLGVMAQLAGTAGGSEVVGAGSALPAQLLEAWQLIVPSTHHDYITGTGIDDVTWSEQMPMLARAQAQASSLVGNAVNTIAGAISPGSLRAPVVVFNSTGVARSDALVELTAEQSVQSCPNGPPSGGGLQVSSTGGLLFLASVPALGYRTVDIAAMEEAPTAPVSLTAASDSITLSNGILEVQLTPDASGVWQLCAVTDLVTGVDMLDGSGNDLIFFADGGSEYTFGLELAADTEEPSTWAQFQPTWSAPSLEILEGGPIRARVRTAATASSQSSAAAFEGVAFIREYELVANESQLRMRTTGSAPMAIGGQTGCSVFVGFPMRGGTYDSAYRGTPYHWQLDNPPQHAPTLYWEGITCLPAHNFVIPAMNGASPWGAVYQASMHAWGMNWSYGGGEFSNDGKLYGCLFRNTSGTNFAPLPGYSPPTGGTNPFTSTLEYSLRIPTGLMLPAEGALADALACTNELLAAPVSQWTGALPASMQLASLSDPRALITALKAGDGSPAQVVCRIYQPTNAALDLTLAVAAPGLGSNPLNATVLTALEQPVADASAYNLQPGANQVSFTAPFALMTLAVAPPI